MSSDTETAAETARMNVLPMGMTFQSGTAGLESLGIHIEYPLGVGLLKMCNGYGRFCRGLLMCIIYKRQVRLGGPWGGVGGLQ
eukprot:1352255-Amorphochlora_amoeboformis.AAC.1